MRGLLSTLGIRRTLSGADRDRIMMLAIRLHRELSPEAEIQDALEREGAPGDIANQINREARARVDREIAASVKLPSSARRDINYYFLLGLTPAADPEQIHRAYRRKAREVHPDRHQSEFVVDQWEDLMTVVADASSVLTDPRKRRAYDVFWRERSQTVAMRYRRSGDKRGDLQTRYLWDIAEMAEIEERLTTLLDRLRHALADGSDVTALTTEMCNALEQYEGRMIEIRTGATALPEHLAPFADRVRAEMQRKERFVQALRQLLPRTPAWVSDEDRMRMAARSAPAADVLEDIRRAQNLFELGSARPFI